ncbi:MAG: hypothetical protein ACRD3W_25575, partial [Terriglobales bacterium]
MATVVQGPRNPASYQTAPLEMYSVINQALARRLYDRVAAVVGSNRVQGYKGSYSVLASTSEATVGKIIICESGRGKTNGDWPDLEDGVYVLIRANDEIGDRIWNELLPARLPAELQHRTRAQTIGVAPAHSEQFAYVLVGADNFEYAVRYLA